MTVATTAGLFCFAPGARMRECRPIRPMNSRIRRSEFALVCVDLDYLRLVPVTFPLHLDVVSRLPDPILRSDVISFSAGVLLPRGTFARAVMIS